MSFLGAKNLVMRLYSHIARNCRTVNRADSLGYHGGVVHSPGEAAAGVQLLGSLP